MQSATLDQIRPLVDQLSLRDQARLLAYLTPRITQAVVVERPQPSLESGVLPEAWLQLFEVGDAIAASNTGESLTTAVTASRR